MALIHQTALSKVAPATLAMATDIALGMGHAEVRNVLHGGEIRSDGMLHALIGDYVRIIDYDTTRSDRDAVVIRLGDVCRVHYGYSVVNVCLREVYGL